MHAPKLTDEESRQVVDRYTAGARVKDLAAEFDVSLDCIYRRIHQTRSKRLAPRQKCRSCGAEMAHPASAGGRVFCAEKACQEAKQNTLIRKDTERTRTRDAIAQIIAKALAHNTDAEEMVTQLVAWKQDAWLESTVANSTFAEHCTAAIRDALCNAGAPPNLREAIVIAVSRQTRRESLKG